MNRFQQIQIAIACIGLPVALVLWFAFVRQVPARTANAVIQSKEFLDAHTVTRYPSGIFRQSWTPNQIRIGAAFVFGMDLEGAGKAFFALDTLAGKDYEVGQSVPVRYEVRGIPPVWKKIRVLGIGPE